MSGRSDLAVDHVVKQAREAGYSWTVIGERLGVSRQAARRRYADRVAHAPATVGLIRGRDLEAGLAAALAAAEADDLAEAGTGRPVTWSPHLAALCGRQQAADGAGEHAGTVHLVPPRDRIASWADLHRQRLTAATAATRPDDRPRRALAVYHHPYRPATLDRAGPRPAAPRAPAAAVADPCRPAAHPARATSARVVAVRAAGPDVTRAGPAEDAGARRSRHEHGEGDTCVLQLVLQCPGNDSVPRRRCPRGRGTAVIWPRRSGRHRADDPVFPAAAPARDWGRGGGFAGSGCDAGHASGITS
ncbi:hypothetical protein [Streptomyces sp. NPDC052107]|uniref:hypothetical protein n=1 Tax=Streptomyces sp. NPDC052107 TaxID=3155632 RepID=UPI003415EE88